MPQAHEKQSLIIAAVTYICSITSAGERPRPQFVSFGDCSDSTLRQVWPWSTHWTMSLPVGSLTTPIAITSPSTTRAFLHFRLFRETISTGLQILRCIAAIDFGGEIWFFTLFASFGDCSDGTLRQVWPCNEVLSYRKAMVWTTHLTMSSTVCSLTTPIAISSPSTTHASLHFWMFEKQ